MSKLKNITLYGVCTVLVVFYLVVLYLGMNPEVPPVYEMYYITHELRDWPGYENLDYDLGTLEYCTGNYDKQGNLVTYKVANRKGTGWAGSNWYGSYNMEDEAFMYYYPNQSKEDATFYISIREMRQKGKIKIYVGDEYIGHFDKAGEFKYTIPKVVADEKLVIRFETEGGRFTLWKAMIS